MQLVLPALLLAGYGAGDGDAAEHPQQAPVSSDEQDEEQNQQATDADDATEDSMQANPTQEHDDTEGTDPDRLASSEQKQ